MLKASGFYCRDLNWFLQDAGRRPGISLISTPQALSSEPLNPEGFSGTGKLLHVGLLDFDDRRRDSLPDQRTSLVSVSVCVRLHALSFCHDKGLGFRVAGPGFSGAGEDERVRVGFKQSSGKPWAPQDGEVFLEQIPCARDAWALSSGVVGLGFKVCASPRSPKVTEEGSALELRCRHTLQVRA